MHYVLYLDVLFLTDLYLDFLILLLCRTILRYHTAVIKMFLTAVLMSAIMSCAVIYPVGTLGVKFLLLKLISGALAVRICFKARGREGLMTLFVFYVAGSLLAGGVLLLWNPVHVKELLGCATFLTAILIFLIRRIGRILPEKYFLYGFKISCMGKQAEGIALLDSGNSLVDPCSRKEVHIVSQEVAEKLELNSHMERIRLIPYHCVGTSHGLLEGYFADEMVLMRNEKQWHLKRPLLAIYKGEISESDRYQVILNSLALK